MLEDVPEPLGGHSSGKRLRRDDQIFAPGRALVDCGSVLRHLGLIGVTAGSPRRRLEHLVSQPVDLGHLPAPPMTRSTYGESTGRRRIWPMGGAKPTGVPTIVGSSSERRERKLEHPVGQHHHHAHHDTQRPEGSILDVELVAQELRGGCDACEEPEDGGAADDGPDPE